MRHACKRAAALMLATPTRAAQAHRVLATVGIKIGTPEYAVWQRSVKEKASARTRNLIHRTNR